MTDTPCQFEDCPHSGVLIYFNRDVCVGHHRELCRADPAAELELLGKLDLTRTAQGEVVETAVGN